MWVWPPYRSAQKALEWDIKECAQAEEDMKGQPLSDSADDRLARVEQDVCEQRCMIKELVTAQREASATQAAASSDLTSDNGCLHGAPRLFTSILTPSEGATDKAESALSKGPRRQQVLDPCSAHGS